MRLRVGYKILVNFSGQNVYLDYNGLTLCQDEGMMCIQEDIEEIIKNVTEHSVYAFNEQIKQGYLTTKNGVRIGLAGDCIFDNGQIITINHITSLNIRIPHQVIGCANGVINYILNKNAVFNTLIISPAGYGKTTLLKDIARQLNEKIPYSILIIDERGEFDCVNGQYIDKVRYCNKLYAFSYSIRSLSPRIVITDELVTVNDWLCCKDAINCGASIIASCHAKNLNEVFDKQYYINNVFERFILLDCQSRAGDIVGIFDREGNGI